MGWKAIFLAAGHSEESNFHKDVAADGPKSSYKHLLGMPKLLTPIAGAPVVEHWLRQLKQCGIADGFVIVTNETYAPQFREWAAAGDHPPECVLSDGTTQHAERLGAAGDLKLAVEHAWRREGKGASGGGGGKDKLLVVAGDTLLYHDFDLSAFLETAALAGEEAGGGRGMALVYYGINDPSEAHKRGVIEVEPLTLPEAPSSSSSSSSPSNVVRVTALLEKPDASNNKNNNDNNSDKGSAPLRRFAAPALYAMEAPVAELVVAHVANCQARGAPLADWAAPGKLVSWLLQRSSSASSASSAPTPPPPPPPAAAAASSSSSGGGVSVFALPVEGRFDVDSLAQYRELNTYLERTTDQHLNTRTSSRTNLAADAASVDGSSSSSSSSSSSQRPQQITERSYARIGLMGNPSDGFNGKTVSMLLGNFHATVTLRESERLVLVRHPEHDATEFDSLTAYHRHASLNGYYGGLRLLQAVCKKFAECCGAAKVPASRLARNFAMSYDTNIPRMVGLSGSSAIIVAAFKALLRFYSLSLEGDLGIETARFPQVILDVEMAELGITAGLQDRVIQVYGGLVHMDFGANVMASTGHGIYTVLSPKLLPPLYLAYNTNAAGDSGKVHSDVKARWHAGDETIRGGMASVAALADGLMEALRSGDFDAIPTLMATNFSWRRRMYGDAVVGARNIEMIETAAAHGMAAKFTGSGGAIVCVRDLSKSSGGGGGGGGGGRGEPSAYLLSEEEERLAKEDFASRGFEFMKVIVPQASGGSLSSGGMVLQID